MTMPDSTHLATLVAVVDEESFEGAAYVMGVSTSAVSQRIRALEEAVGHTVVRRTKPVEPTASGRVLLRLARQEALLRADALSELGHHAGRTVVSVVINADSLATWALEPLQRVAERLPVTFDVRREDQDSSTGPLRDGTAMAAVTSVADPVPGCTSTPLGTMAYHPMASWAFMTRHFPDGVTADALAAAPMVNFDRSDDLQLLWARRHTPGRIDPPVHYVPESTTYGQAVRLGLGWGMIPALQATGDLVPLAAGEQVDVPLFWQRWKLDSPLLDAVSAAFADAARQGLR
ncbi:LysR family transcriptional regulator ArgP [Mariniluteicoccus endophyticus]